MKAKALFENFGTVMSFSMNSVRSVAEVKVTTRIALVKVYSQCQSSKYATASEAERALKAVEGLRWPEG